jgi:GNAT superfamily N-acetyltransferase
MGQSNHFCAAKCNLGCDTKVVEFASVESNLRESFRVLARHTGTGELREYAGVSIASAGVTFQMFNAAFLSAPVRSEADLDGRIAQSAVHFQARNLEWACWVCESWLDPQVRRRARQVFRGRNLHLSVELPGMVAETLDPPARPLPALEIRRVADRPTRDAFCDIGSLCFNVPLAWFTEVFCGDAVFKDFAGYVGYADGEPVSTAATVIGSGVVGVYNVATLPARQRRGYGEAVMRHALGKARQEHGIARTILQSTPQGYPLYERMGYRTVTKVAVYST